MQALRNIYTVNNNQITIILPDYFKHSSVEVIILPIEKSKNNKLNIEDKKNKQLKKLLSLGVWNDEDIKPIIESQKYINQWKITEF